MRLFNRLCKDIYLIYQSRMLEKQEITCLVIDKINENEYQIY